MEAPPATTAPAAAPPPVAKPAEPAPPAPKPAEPKPQETGPPAALPPGAAARDSAVWNLPIRTYLDQTIVPIMLDGMAVRSRARTLRRVAATACRWGRHRRVASTQELVKVRPEDPILWMADYLRDNNPNTNADAAARAAKRRRLDEEARAAEAAKPAV